MASPPGEMFPPQRANPPEALNWRTYTNDVLISASLLPLEKLMQNLRILIVDDEHEAGEILSLRLRRRGMKPSYASSGEDALVMMQEQPADIVLLDIKMPGMDGLEVLRRIRAGYPGTSVIILSGHADMDAAAEGLELGAFVYLLKPVNLDDLCHKIEDARRQKELEKR